LAIRSYPLASDFGSTTILSAQDRDQLRRNNGSSLMGRALPHERGIVIS